MKIILNYEIASVFERCTSLEVLPLKPYKRLSAPVSAHADMLICVIGNRAFSYVDYIEENKEIFDCLEKSGYEIVKCAPPTSPNYPNDIGLNVAVVGKRLFCNVKSTAEEIKSYAREKGYELVDVKQGYAACTTLILDEYNVITGDPSIKKAMESKGINVLFIKEESILLHGYNQGFIGGASLVANGTVYFFGDAEELKEYKKISALISSLKMKIFSISSGEVVDFGGGKLI